MKKFGIIVLAMVFVLSLTVGALADGVVLNGNLTDSTTTTLTVSPYATIEFFDSNLYQGLFPEALEGMAGLYVSDGNATKNAANLIWGYDDGSGYVGGNLMESGSVVYNLDPTNNFVDPFVVDMNTPILIDMEVDWTEWAEIPTLFRISSDEELSYSGVGGNGIGNWAANLAMVTNVELLNGAGVNLRTFVQDAGFTAAAADYKVMDIFSTFGEEGAFICQGPFEFHLNGAVYLPKVGSLLAGEEYTAEITLTVQAAPSTVVPL